jgi:hypothetical protein
VGVLSVLNYSDETSVEHENIFSLCAHVRNGDPQFIKKRKKEHKTQRLPLDEMKTRRGRKNFFPFKQQSTKIFITKDSSPTFGFPFFCVSPPPRGLRKKVRKNY